VIGDLDQRLGRDDLDVRAGPSRLRAAGGRADQPFIAPIGTDRRRQNARHRRQRAVEPEFAEDGEPGQRIMRDRADRRHQAKRDRQIVVAAFLGQIGRRQIDDDASRRQRETRCSQRRPHAFARFRDGLVREADDDEVRQARNDLHLHVHRAGLDSLERNRRDMLHHATSDYQPKVAA
jgi:hypothetical protein